MMWNKEDLEDFTYRYKKRLTGNLKFIAELYKKKLISANIPMIVLTTLLGGANVKHNDLTIEGACTFFEKVGIRLDKRDKVEKLKEEGGNSPTKKEGKDGEGGKKSFVKNQEIFEDLFKTLKNFHTDESVDSRVRYIIQNWIETRKTGWEDKELNEGPKTKKQIKKDHEAALRGDEEVKTSRSSKKLGKSSYQKVNKSKNTKGMFASLEMSKIDSTTSGLSDLEEDHSIPKPVEKHYSPREMEHMDHEAIKDRMIGNFDEWIKTGEFNFDMFKKPENQCSKDQILEFLLDKLYDKQEKDVKKFNHYFFELYEKDLFGKNNIENALSNFFKIIPDIEADFPHLANLFSGLLYFIFVDKNIADFKKVKIELVGDNEDLKDDEEPMYFIDIYFKILASLMTKIEHNLDQEKLLYFYKQFNIENTAKLLKPFMLEDDLFSELPKVQGASKTVVQLLDVKID